jgi:thiol:disulfide interchange protein DsbD
MSLHATLLALLLSATPQECEASLVPSVSRIAPGSTFTVGVRFKIEEGWHIYWMNPGDSGMPTAIKWKLPPGFKTSQIHWPYPHRMNGGGITNYGFDNELMLLVDVAAPQSLRPGTNVTLAADLSWLICKESCVPGSASVAVTLPVGSTPGTNAENAEAIARWAKLVPSNRHSLGESAKQVNAGIQLSVLLPTGEGGDVLDAYFFASREGMVSHSPEQERRLDGSRLTLTLPKPEFGGGTVGTLQGVLTVEYASGTKAFWLRTPVSS